MSEASAQADHGADSILIVDDDKSINVLIATFARLCGVQYRQAYDGLTAIEAAEQVAPRAVILDLMLPDIDGHEVCRRLRASAGTTQTPIIILSALGGEEDRQRSRECGATMHLSKPFHPEEFMKVLTRYGRSAKAA